MNKYITYIGDGYMVNPYQLEQLSKDAWEDFADNPHTYLISELKPDSYYFFGVLSNALESGNIKPLYAPDMFDYYPEIHNEFKKYFPNSGDIIRTYLITMEFKDVL